MSRECRAVPRIKETNKTKPLGEWTLYEMILVAGECGWIKYDVNWFSSVLPEPECPVYSRKQPDKTVRTDEIACRTVFEAVHKTTPDILNYSKAMAA